MILNGNYQIVITKEAQKDKEKVKRVPALRRRAEELLEILREDPFQTPPPYEKLQRDLKGSYSRRLNRQHRIVYTVDEIRKVVKITAMWTHYE